MTVQGTSGDGATEWTGTLAIGTNQVFGARDLFVDPSHGHDTNNGSQATPFKTLTKALSTASPGDTIHLAAGSYGTTANGIAMSVKT